MASISGRGAKAHHTYTLTLTETATSVANNNSTVSFSFDLTDDANWFWEGWNQSISYSVSANGAVVASGYIPNHTTKSQNIAKGTITVPHAADGTKSIAYSFSVTDGANQYYTSGNASASGTMTLSTIPRATTPTFSSKNVTMGSAITITMTPAASTFKHKLRYSWSTLTQQTSGISAGADFTAQGTVSATFTPPTSLANYIPSTSSGTCTVQCYTYDANGNHIGTVNTDITLAVPSYTPTGTITITGNNLLSSTYVQGKSTMGVSITGSTSYGASISSYSSVVDGKTYSGNAFTTGVLGSGSKSVVTTITDSRGKTASVTSSAVTVYEYAAPKITSFTLVRGSDNTTVTATVQGTISSVNSKNAKTVKVVLNGVTNTITSSSYTISGTTTFTGVPTDTTLIGTATLTDSYTTVKQDSMLPTVAVTMDFYKNGNGVAFGKVAETSDLLDVAWNGRVRKNLSVNGALWVGEKINNVTISENNYVFSGAYEGITDENWVTAKPTFLGTYSQNNQWYNTISVRHRNGIGDGTNYGMQLRSKLTETDSLVYRQNLNNTWTSWRTILDTGNLTNTIKDYIIEEGTKDGWNYIKWNNGIIEAYCDKSLTFPAGTQITTNLWRSLVSVDLSSLMTKIISGTCSVQASGMLPQVCRHSSNLATAEIVIATSRTIDSFTITAPLYIKGKWK